MIKSPLSESLTLSLESSSTRNKDSLLILGHLRSDDIGPEDPSNRKKYPLFFHSQIFGNCKTIPKNVSLMYVLEWVPVLRRFTNQQSLSHKV